MQDFMIVNGVEIPIKAIEGYPNGTEFTNAAFDGLTYTFKAHVPGGEVESCSYVNE